MIQLRQVPFFNSFTDFFKPTETISFTNMVIVVCILHEEKQIGKRAEQPKANV